MDLATGAMGSLLHKLGELLTDEYKLQTGVKEDIRYLERELKSMYAALRKVGDVPRDQLDEQVKLWADDVRDMSYEMEDVVDKFLVHVEDAEPTVKPGKLEWFVKKIGDLFTKSTTRHEIGNEIKGIKIRVQEVADRRDRYRVNEVVANPTSGTVDPRLLALYKDQKDLIGIDGTLNKLTKMLTDGDGDVFKQLKIVSIVGLGGLGKTTLAKAVYDKLQTQFDCSAFVPVGRKPSAKKLLNDILFEIDKQKHRESNSSMWEERQLIDELRGSLRKKRYFIVIDDIWDTQTWEIIRCTFLNNSCASRIITTTRIHEVATRTGEVIYRLEPLSYDLSKELFHTRLFGGKTICPYEDQSVEVYDKILHKCGGVPLAIVTMASLLVGKPVESWSKVYSSIGFGYEDNKDVDNTRNILLFSYYDLPCHLKTCLLHLSIYLEDRLVEKDSLIWKWVAEGFVSEEPGVGLYEIGERYFNELINKSMILPVETPHHGIIIGCRVHDMVLHMICLLLKEENFVTLLNSDVNASSHSNAHRLAIGWRSDPLASVCLSQVRSFNATSVNATWPSLSCFQVLRVLALEGGNPSMESTNFLEHVGNLVHLRYLGLEGMNIHELPKEIGDLKFLQTLNLGCKRLKELPESIGQLSQLKCLRTYCRVPDWIGKLTSLEQLQIDEADRSSNFVNELAKLTKLRKLHIRKYLYLNNTSSAKSWAESLVRLQKIHVIDIFQVCSVRSHDTIYCCWEHYANLSQQLRVLHMSYRQPRLLAKITPSLLPNLCHLSVHVDSPDLEIFGRFPKLVTLRLEMEDIHHHDIIGPPGAFRKLRRLTTGATPSMFVGGAMPRLESLWFRIEITPSSKLDGFDFGSLVNLPMLEEVTVEIWYAHGSEHRLAEVAVRHAINILPNPPVLCVETFPKLDLPTKVVQTGHELGSKKRKKDLSWYDRYRIDTSRWKVPALIDHRRGK